MTLQSCRDSFKTDSSAACTQTLEVLTDLQALLAQPVLQETLGQQQQQRLLSDVTALAHECRQHLEPATPTVGDTTSSITEPLQSST